MTTDTIRQNFAAQLDAAGLKQRFVLTDGNAETVMAAADVVLLASGTAALQAALLGRPMVAAYRIAPLTYAIMKTFRLLKVPYFTLPNLLTPEPLVPEFLQGAASPEALANAVSALMNDPDRRAAIAGQFGNVRAELAQGADRLAAQAVLELASGPA
jgi:lipid-A-disaccharide synthase